MNVPAFFVVALIALLLGFGLGRSAPPSAKITVQTRCIAETIDRIGSSNSMPDIRCPDATLHN